MVCGDDIEREIAIAVGTTTLGVPRSRWVPPRYSCDYRYAGGQRLQLSVNQLDGPAATIATFDRLVGTRRGGMRLVGVGDDAYETAAGAVVVRKDDLVLTVDAARLRAEFGVPLAPRAQVAMTVAATVMGCWTGG